MPRRFISIGMLICTTKFGVGPSTMGRESYRDKESSFSNCNAFCEMGQNRLDYSVAYTGEPIAEFSPRLETASVTARQHISFLQNIGKPGFVFQNENQSASYCALQLQRCRTGHRLGTYDIRTRADGVRSSFSGFSAQPCSSDRILQYI